MGSVNWQTYSWSLKSAYSSSPTLTGDPPYYCFSSAFRPLLIDSPLLNHSIESSLTRLELFVGLSHTYPYIPVGLKPYPRAQHCIEPSFPLCQVHQDQQPKLSLRSIP